MLLCQLYNGAGCNWGKSPFLAWQPSVGPESRAVNHLMEATQLALLNILCHVIWMVNAWRCLTVMSTGCPVTRYDNQTYLLWPGDVNTSKHAHCEFSLQAAQLKLSSFFCSPHLLSTFSCFLLCTLPLGLCSCRCSFRFSTV